MIFELSIIGWLVSKLNIKLEGSVINLEINVKKKHSPVTKISLVLYWSKLQLLYSDSEDEIT